MQIEILNMRAVDGGEAVLVTVRLDGDNDGEEQRKAFRLLPGQLIGWHLVPGPIDRETWEALETAAKETEALEKGVQLLAYGACSVAGLARKLRARGFSADVAAGAAARLNELGYIDEEQDALRLGERCRRKGWGPRRIFACLWEKGYTRESISRVEEALSDVDFSTDCLAAMKARVAVCPVDRTGRQKLSAAMVRQGYSPSDIRRALALWMSEAAGDEE